MSASNEWFDYHLTPGGWVAGSEKTDFAPVQTVKTPADAVLTVRFNDYASSMYSKPDRYGELKRRGADLAVIHSLLEKHGLAPSLYLKQYELNYIEALKKP